ncbi:MAG: peptidylprolyl isomerase [Myxococcales bacterium]
MLDNMRTASASPAGKLVMVLLFGLLAVAFGISFGPGSRGCEGLRSSPSFAAKVNGEVISQPEFERYYYNQIRRFGDMDRARVEQYFPRSQVLDELIADRLVAEAATAEGVGVSDAELRDAIVKNPSFQEDGQFSRERYQLVLSRSLGETTDTFEDDMRRGLRIQKMQALVGETAKVTDWQIEQKWREENEKVNLTFVRFAPAFYAGQVSATDAEAEAFAKDHAAEVAAEYGKESYRFHAPKRVQARHLLIKVAQGADGAKAKSALADAKAKALAGTDFGALVRQLSQAGDASGGGELGLVRENDHLFDPAIEKAALALDEGKVSEPIRTAQGWELVQAEKVLPPEDKPLEQVKAQLAQEMVVRQKEGQLAEAAAKSAQEKVAAGGSLDGLFPVAPVPETQAGEHPKFTPPPDHPVADKTGPFARSSVGYLPKIGQSPSLQQAAFALAAPGATTPAPAQVSDAWVVVQLVSHEKPDMDELAKKKTELRENALHQAQMELMQSFRKALLSQAVIERNGAILSPSKG